VPGGEHVGFEYPYADQTGRGNDQHLDEGGLPQESRYHGGDRDGCTVPVCRKIFSHVEHGLCDYRHCDYFQTVYPSGRRVDVIACQQ